MGGGIPFAEWAPWVAVIALVVSFGVFLFFVIAAIRMPRRKIRHDSELPLDDKEKRS
jgi:hypothetical protein